jgi:hypothetical protein
MEIISILPHETVTMFKNISEKGYRSFKKVITIFGSVHFCDMNCK